MTSRPLLSAVCALGIALPGAAVVSAPAQAQTQAQPTIATTAAARAQATGTMPQRDTGVRPSAARSAAMEASIARTLTAGSRSQYLRAGLSGYVIDGTSGDLIWSSNATRTRMPASTQKVVTAYVSLRSLHPNAQIITKSAQSRANPNNVYVVGAGDPTLTRARLTSLAARTAQSLAAQGRKSVNVYLDDTVFPRPTPAQGWKSSYLRRDVQMVRGLTMAGYRGADGTVAAGNVFRAELIRQGIAVRTYGRGTAPRARNTLAESWSPTVRSILSAMLNYSNNDYAEYLLRLSAQRAGIRPTWTGSLAHARNVLADNGVPTKGYIARDGSGLSRANRMPVRTLVRVVAKLHANRTDRAITFAPGAMPRSGQTGTMRTRYKSTAQRCAIGRVLAKTGTLNDVVGLAGVAKGVDGRDRIFAFIENGNRKTASVRNAVDSLATTAVGCRL